MARRRSVSVLLAAVAAIIAACAPSAGQGPTVGREARVVELTVTASVPSGASSPSTITDVRTPRSAASCRGRLSTTSSNITASDHEMFIGSAAEQEMHNAEHLGLPPVEQAAIAHFGYGIFLPAFGDGVLEYHFAEPGEVLIGCHLPGHYEGGHVATVVVGP